jgi:hypothetical protein
VTETKCSKRKVEGFATAHRPAPSLGNLLSDDEAVITDRASDHPHYRIRAIRFVAWGQTAHQAFRHFVIAKLGVPSAQVFWHAIEIFDEDRSLMASMAATDWWICLTGSGWSLLG